MIQQEVPSKLVRNSMRYAVMLNANAKRWTGNLHEEVLRWVPRTDLYLTDDFAQAKLAVEKLLTSDYKVILTGGGDGTINFLINEIESAIARGVIQREDAPPIGVLKMGTGNAIARWVEADKIIADLRRWRSGSPLAYYQVNMIDDGELLGPFAGFGWDADIINDYDSFRGRVEGTLLEHFLTGALGYATSILGKTLPKHLISPAKKIVVTALDDVIQIRPNGDEITTFSAGEVIFEGRSKIFGCASIPFWGYGIRMFPYANARPGMFQFRTFNGDVSQVLTSLPKFWRGEIEEHCHDFLCSHIRVDVVDGRMGYQVAGDPRGERTSVEWKLHPHPVTLVVPLSLRVANEWQHANVETQT